MENIITVDHSRENPYLMVCRKTVRDAGLDLQAKGLLVFLLDKPPDWRVRPDALARELGVGRATIYRVLDRLIAAGYVHRELVRRKKDGRYQTGAVYVVFEDKDCRREWLDRSKFERAPEQGPDFAGVPF